MTKVKIYIKLKKSVLDPQGQAIQDALKNMGFSGVDKVRQGKIIEFELHDKDLPQVIVHEMCRHLLVNEAIEDYKIELERLK